MINRTSIVFLLLGALVGAGGVGLYSLLAPRANLDQRVVMSRYILQVPIAACKQFMVIGFRSAGFQTVTPDPGDNVGVGAIGDKISGAAMCMPALGVAAVAMSGTDQNFVLARMQDFANAMAVTNFIPQNQPAQPRR